MPFSFLFLSSLFFLSTCFRRMAAYYAVKSANDRKAKKAAFDKIFARFDHNHNGERDISSAFLQLPPFRKGFCERLLWGAAPGRPWSRRGGSSEVDSFRRRRRSSHKGWIQNLLQTFRALSKLGQVSHKSFYRKYFLTQESRWSGVGFGDDQQDPVGVQGPWQEQRWLHFQERVQWDLKVSHQGAGHSWKHKIKASKSSFSKTLYVDQLIWNQYIFRLLQFWQGSIKTEMGSCHMQSSRNCSRSETILEKKFWPIFSFFIFYWYGMLINIFNDKYPITRVCIYWIIQHIGICNWWPHYCKSVTPWHEKNKRKIYDRRYIYKG